MSLRKPLVEWAGFLYAKGDFRSVLCMLVCSIVLIVLAYLTNPSENSFRAYLTEQSFRYHLSRLDDTADDPDGRDKSSSSQRRDHSTSSLTVPFDHDSPFHFANRASVSLRTPKHVFHSFGIFTVAAIVPSRADRSRNDRDPSAVMQSWFFGAFGLPFSTKGLPVSRSPPKLRNRDKLSQRLPARSSTPPPLPKSASLPLHTPRLSPSDRQNLSQVTLSPDQKRVGAPSLSRSPSTLFDQSPLIAEVLQQITTSKASVLELRTQLADFQVSATTSHSALQAEVDSFRDRKRQEDASRLELKLRTKTLDDSKRAAESVKREADKRYKAAEAARDEANRRMDFLDNEIALLTKRLAEDQCLISQSDPVSEAEPGIVGALEEQRQEIKVAEDVLSALNLKARELEDKLSSEQERLKLARERAELRKQDRSFQPHHAPSSGPWPTVPRNFYDSSILNKEKGDSPAMESPARRSSDPNALPTSPRPAKLALDSISNLNSRHTVHSWARASRYSHFDDTFLNQHLPHAFSNFSPFGDSHSPALMSPTSQSLIPSSLISSLDSSDGISRSFHSDSDPIVEMEGRQLAIDTRSSPIFGPLTMSPTALTGPSLASPEAAINLPPIAIEKPTGRRWFSARDKAKKGLNPDAKEFSLPSKAATFDALNPNGLSGANMIAPASATHSLIRAFAPSPAEREALQRALGGSTNTSLERLPSLGSIPASPAHVPAVAAGGDGFRALPSWLTSLPRIRKPNFSPWDDEEVKE
ncbi:unnamed protein product [Mycena citricolor]|uniref:Proteophosphoglycan ppg4 n=1 Tax=Mycena citricolor TaxID=2018698 RepID=A0AAD2HST7_9AGAR|nr:unnamed protein product [Mycena citricolor]